ncbi:membrane protein [Desulfosarcina alkanivorans]|uniref:Membrane protein n=1 Tax=Desulfosarcina alkanivorans TaxID=571177 RepID=A0A5K7YFX4_9BACT|nr:YitT family protein [Desulfosarcina alkanivorans]BBO68452.1 membrane protein [Desulfosarcina alkanivorans]
MKKFFYHQFISSVLWNLFLITAGSIVFGIGLKAIAIPHGFITGGISGLTLLFYYVSGLMSPGLWYLIVNVPIFLIGWIHVSRRFFLYSLYGMAALSMAIDLIGFTLPIREPILGVLAGGVLMGAGTGIILHSLGSAGGMDIVAIILNQKFNVRMGTFYFAFNIVLFAFSFGFLEADLVLYSLFMSFISSQTLDYVLTIFNQRKMVIIISDCNDRISREIHSRLRRGVTFLNGSGAYTGRDKKIILTVIHNYQLKRLEEAALSIDPEAFIITENTFNVLGRGFSRRKVY